METKNKIKHKWSLIAHSSSIDKDSNSFSIFNMIDEISGTIIIPKSELSNPFINIPIDFELISLWERIDLIDNKEISVDVEILFEIKGSKKLKNDSKIEYKVVIPADKKRIRFRTKISGISVAKKGIHVFKVFLKEKGEKKSKKVGEILLPVDIVTKPQ